MTSTSSATDLCKGISTERERRGSKLASEMARLHRAAVEHLTNAIDRGVQLAAVEHCRESISGGDFHPIRSVDQKYRRSCLMQRLPRSCRHAVGRKHVDVFEIAEEVVREGQIAAQEKPISVQLEGGRTIAWADPRARPDRTSLGFS